MQEYKAYIVTSTVATRVIVPVGSTRKEIFDIASPRIARNFLENGDENTETIEADIAMPFNSDFDIPTQEDF